MTYTTALGAIMRFRRHVAFIHVDPVGNDRCLIERQAHISRGPCYYLALPGGIATTADFGMGFPIAYEQ